MSRARKIWKWTAAAFGIVAVLLAVAVGALRVWLEHSHELVPQVVARVEQLTGLRFAFAQLDARLGLHGPEFVFRDARITVPGQRDALVTATAGRVGFDLWRSLATLRIASGRVVLEGARVYLYLTPDGVELRGQGALGADSGGARLRLGELPVGRVRIEDGTVTVQDLRQPSRPWRIDRVNLDLERDPSTLRVSADVRLPDALGARLAAEARLDGDLAAPATLDWQAEVRLKRAAIAGWTALVPQWPWLPQAGSGDLEVRAAGKGALLTQARARFDLRNVRLPTAPGAKVEPLATLAGELSVAHAARRWSASGRELTIDPGHDPWRRGEFDFSLDTDPSGALQAVALRTPAVRLDALSALVPLLPAGTLREAGDALAPRGALTLVDLRALRGSGPHEWRIDGGLRFTALGIGPWGRVPGLTGLDGELAASGAAGRVRLRSRAFTLALPEYLRAPVGADELAATLDWWWQPDGWRFAVDGAHSASADGHGEGVARLWIPADEESPRLVLDLHLFDIDARAAPKYLPATKIPPKALAWLDHAFLGGRVSNVRFEYAGEMRRFPFRDGGGQFRIRLRFQDIRLHYQDGFADVENARGEAQFLNQGVSARADSARVGGLEVGSAEVALADLGDAELSARASVHGDVRDGLAYLQRSPIGPKLGAAFMRLGAHGPMSAEVTLDLPFTRFAERHVAIATRFEHVEAELAGLAAPFSELAGSFTLRDRELEVPALRGTAFGGPLQIALHTVAGPSGAAGERVLVAEGSGRASGEQLQALVGITHGSYLQGACDWKLQARLPRFEWRPAPEPPPAGAPPGAQPQPREIEIRMLPGTLKLDSTLAGLALALPAPFAKAADEARSSRADVLLDPGLERDAPAPPAGALRRRDLPHSAAITARIQSGRDSAALEWRKDPDWALARGTLRFGGTQAALREAGGVWVEGRMPDYDLSAWLAVKFSDAPGKGFSGYLRGGTLSIDRFAVFGYRFPEVTLVLEGREHDYRVQVDGPAARGVLIVPLELPGTGVLSLDMDRLVVGEPTPSPAAAQTTDPTTLPALSVAVRELTVEGRHFGTFKARASRTEDGLQLDEATIKGASFEGSGRGSWALTGSGQSTVFAFNVASSNLLDTLNAWGFVPTLTGRAAHASGELRWPGGIEGEIVGRLGGHVSIAVEQGQLMSVEPGAGRVLGLMSVAALPRRLTLDFSDLTDKGFAFDSVKGDFDFRDGNAYTNNLVLKGPAGEIGIVGRTGLKARDYDQTAKVTGHLGGPLAAAGMLAAGPAVGAALLLFSTVFKEPLSGFARGYYRITGTWDKPHVERIGAGAAREAAGESGGAGGGR